ncbi:GTP cyclohydrolase II [Halocola ammonii]
MAHTKAEELARTNLPTEHGNFTMIAYKSEFEQFPHIVLFNGEINPGETQIVRIHSECMTGDVFSSARCECGEQLEKSMEIVGEKGGVLVYLRQEGRGIGLVEKMKAYNLQDKGMDTVEANLALGHQKDMRNFDIAVAILEKLGVQKMKLLTNNPEKVEAIESTSIELVERLPLEIKARKENTKYLETKKKILGHFLDMK